MAAYAAWVIPAVVGTVLGLQWWTTLLLLVPGAAWYSTTRWQRYPVGSAWDRVPIVYALPGIIVIALVMSGQGLPGMRPYAGCFAVALLLGADLLRGSRRETEGATVSPVRPLGA